MANKIYTTLRQQLKILRSKNMNISINGQGAKVKKILERENYYSVINGYKDPFIQTSSNNETFQILNLKICILFLHLTGMYV